jgi:S1-C subfamily serine protease
MTRFKLAALLAAGASLALPSAHAAAQSVTKTISLGVQMAVRPEGPEVVAMRPDRTAAAAGFKVGDILLEVGGKPVSQEVLQAYLKQTKEGDQVNFKVKRAGAVVELSGKAVGVPEGEPAPTGQPVTITRPEAQPEG